MKSFKGLWPLLAAAAIGAIVIFFAEPVSRWLETKSKKIQGPVVGHVARAVGNVTRVHGAEQSPVADGMELHDGDRLQTAGAARADLVLNSQDEIELGSQSAIELQLWSPRDPNSPIYVHLSAGEVTSRKAGVKGRAYIVRDGRLYLPGQTPVKKALALTVLRNAPLDLQIDEGTRDGAPGSGDFEADTGVEKEAGNAPASTADPETLSNEYIDETILAHQGQLQKCWLSRLKDAPKLKGQVIVQFEISKRGKVREMRVADSTLNDEVLEKCAMSVIERISFRPYKGSEISLSYPINFE